ncbi:galactose-6-phosphate isomerase subunit LacA [Vagococcus acidifermentans]|uniref:Galactose-6-phosphate isomerase subunit LacA n=1 Tax=Vagococcus acidifermentans TaxID=564710 RepID=A0A430B312_9ENTE|nr:galactose-6-phosphate isomerase subunit LacA [Vagococcus acidifermentans]RSU14713.1 galactose-6-phosphate isomerase subunit LacA [Vagococcus acidifermentans]
MKVILGTDQEGMALKETVKTLLTDKGYEVLDVSPTPAADFIAATQSIVDALYQHEDALAIAFDGYGAGSFIAATKHPHIIAAEISEERSAYMTREHNNSRMIALGANIVGTELAKNIVLAFLEAAYDGGRHQIRVDMLNKMC